MTILRTLFVASTGGHLEELLRLQPRLHPGSDEVHWATADTEQSRALLAGSPVSWTRLVRPRDWVGAAASLGPAVRILRESAADRVVSTGAALALPFFLAAARQGVECHYIESAARSQGPSLTGRLSTHLPGVRLYSQYPAWADSRWRYAGSVFDAFSPAGSNGGAPASGLRRVVVTLGTQTGFSFRRAVEALCRLLPEVCAADADVLWQTGGTDASSLGIDARRTVPPGELKQAVESADLVIAHAGVGSALCALDAGRAPVLMPRRRAHGEHTDDHQMLVAGELQRRGLAVGADPWELTAALLWQAAGLAVTSVEAGPLRLTDPPGAAVERATRSSTEPGS